MTRGSSNHEPTFGYLSAVHSAEHGYFGGYLIISILGRPLEFHCSAPVRPSRAQEILYGPTLPEYLLGEQIGGTLLRRAKLSTRLVLTDQPAVLCLRPGFDVPFLHLAPQDVADVQLNASSAARASNNRFAVGSYEFETAAGYSGDQKAAGELLTCLAERVDLAEPFDRIREAIREAQRIGNRGQDAHGQAA